MIDFVQCSNPDGSADESIAIYMPLSSEPSVPGGSYRIPTAAQMDMEPFAPPIYMYRLRCAKLQR